MKGYILLMGLYITEGCSILLSVYIYMILLSSINAHKNAIFFVTGLVDISCVPIHIRKDLEAYFPFQHGI